MIQDICPYEFNNQYSEKRPCDSDFIIVFDDSQIYMAQNKTQECFPNYKQVCAVAENVDESLIYLFSIDTMNFFLGMDIHLNEAEAMVKRDIQIFSKLEPNWMAFAGITGHHLYHWYSDNKYCGKCAKPMVHHKVERALVCEQCNRTEYPKIAPAIIVGITNGDELLLTKYSQGSYKKYALIAGFTEIGETLEETVKREVMEEVGLEVKNIRYYKNQPWAFSGSLLVGFYAELDGRPEVKIDEEELAEATWFSRGEIPPGSSTIGLTYDMIEDFRNNKITF
ncbi:MAG: NAD(+) diphosphatase [Acetobacterium sp.]